MNSCTPSVSGTSNRVQIEIATLWSIGLTSYLVRNIILENAAHARHRGILMMFNLSCTTPTMPSPTEGDLPFKEEIARHALLVKEVVLAPWM